MSRAERRGVEASPVIIFPKGRVTHGDSLAQNLPIPTSPAVVASMGSRTQEVNRSRYMLFPRCWGYAHVINRLNILSSGPDWKWLIALALR